MSASSGVSESGSDPSSAAPASASVSGSGAPVAEEDICCPICLTPFSSEDSVYRTDCHHYYCGDCLARHILTSNVCCLCRADIHQCTLMKPKGTTQTNQQLYKQHKHGSEEEDPPALDHAGAAEALFLVQIKYNKQTFDLLLPDKCTYKQFSQRCAELFSLSTQHIKLIHKGKLLSAQLNAYLTQVLAKERVPVFQLIASIPDDSKSKWGNQNENQSKCEIQ